MNRQAKCVVVRMVEETVDGDTRTSFYGPFMPHAGSATERVTDSLYQSAVGRGSVPRFYLENVFIGEGESDLEAFQ